MKRLGGALSVLLAALVIAYLVFMPGYLDKRLDVGGSNVFHRETGGETGIVRVWYVVGFKPYSGSGAEWLKACAAYVEGRNYGLFFDISAMTDEEYAERRAAGEGADIYAFPAGLMAAEELQPLDTEGAAYAEAGAYGGDTLAVPAFLSGYTLISNTALMQKAGALGTAELERMAGGCVQLALYDFVGEVLDRDAFYAGKCEYMLGDMRTVMELEIRQKRGVGFVFDAKPAGIPCDLIQLIGVDKDAGPAKRQAAEMLIERALSEKQQKKLAPMGLLPVTQTAFDATQAPQLLSGMMEYPEYAPNAFLYNENLERMETLAVQAVDGDNNARKELEGLTESLFIAPK